MIVRALCALLLVLLTGCSSDEGATDDRPEVVGSFYPLAFAAETIAAGEAAVTDLTPPGSEPHDLELTSQQVVTLARADLVVYLGGGFQPVIEDALEGVDGATLDVLPPGTDDPHIWLDPVAMIDITEAIAGALADVDPDNATSYRNNAAGLATQLEELHEEYQASLDSCRTRTLISAHDAFSHLAARYDLNAVGIAGSEPEAEPSPQRLSEVIALARREAVTTIFTETLLPDDAARAVADNIDGRTEPLATIETAEEMDYLSAMRTNLDSLRRGLGCR